MKINPERVKTDLSLTPFGAKGWLANHNMECPWCGRAGKFGFIFKGKSGVTHCFFCDTSKPVSIFLKETGRTELLSFEREFVSGSKLKSLRPKKTKIKDEIKDVSLPRGIKRLKNDPYLDGRGFTKEHYKLFQPSFTKHFIEHKLHDTIIFKIFNNGKLVSWLARSRKSYEWHKENLEQFKAGEARLHLRYTNSEGTEFEKILGGLDEITENTEVVIVCEGLFDKINVDRRLKLNKFEETKCIFTFGNKFSSEQMNLLKAKKSVKTVILMYDHGTVKISREVGLNLSNYWQTWIAHLDDPDIDPGDMTLKQLNKVLGSVYSPMNYFSKLNA